MNKGRNIITSIYFYYRDLILNNLKPIFEIVNIIFYNTSTCAYIIYISVYRESLPKFVFVLAIIIFYVLLKENVQYIITNVPCK